MLLRFVLLVVVSFVGIRSQLLEPIRLNTEVHLFVDNKYLDDISTLEFENGLIEKDLDNPIVYPEYPWESAVHFYTNFLQVPSQLSVTGKPMYLIYYSCVDSSTIIFFNNVSICVANSSDGVRWEKPLFWYYPYTANGTKPSVPTNIVFITDVNEFLGSVFVDTRSGIPRSEIFKMTYEHEPARYVYVGISSDGFEWHAGTKRAHPLAGLSDTQTVMLYSQENNGQYVLYGRQNGPSLPNSTFNCPGDGTTPSHRRVVITVSSQSAYGPWSQPKEAFELGEPDPIQCYDNYNPATLYYSGVYMIFPSGFLHWAANDSGAPSFRAAANDGVMDIRLAVSRTALGPYRFVTRDSFLSRGIGQLDPNSKLFNVSGSDRDAGFVFSSANGLLDPDFVRQSSSSSSNVNPSSWMYHIYWGSQTTHAGGGAYLGRYWPNAYSGIFKARLRREGYVALSTKSSNPTGLGSLLTQPILLPKSFDNNEQELQLKLNAQIATAGFVLVQFEDATTGKAIEGYSFEQSRILHGNGIRQLVQWTRSNQTFTGDLTPLINYTNGLRIRFQMAHTKLYSWIFSFVDDI